MLRLDSQHRTERTKFQAIWDEIERDFQWKVKDDDEWKIELGGKIQTTALKPIRVVLWIRKESLLRSIHFHWPRKVEK